MDDRDRRQAVLDQLTGQLLAQRGVDDGDDRVRALRQLGGPHYRQARSYAGRHHP
ncbi:MAG TPA: hypothetical protein VMM13_05325 [Euzebya sp.]|nr:hypothetical protein [Euzebya sp.]